MKNEKKMKTSGTSKPPTIFAKYRTLKKPIIRIIIKPEPVRVNVTLRQKQFVRKREPLPEASSSGYPGIY